MARERGADEKVEERGPTQRVVLRRERVLVLPEGLTGEAFEKTKGDIAKAVGVRAGALNPVEGWIVVGVFEGGTKDKAIERHAGKPGTPDAKPGAYKAPTASAWAGGLIYEAPPAPLVQKRALD
jgi:hypothetical protein